MSAIVEIKEIQVVKKRHTILDVPELTVNRGETFTVIGPNGAGKSTLLRVLGLLEAPAQGTVTFDGEPVKFRGNLLRFRRKIALVLQEAMLRNASTFENVATGLRFRGISHRETSKRAEVWMERLDISHLKRQNARTLSGGEAQRVSLARALVLDPELLLLDEPFSALDEPSRDSLMEDLQRILDETKISTIFVTHQRSEALAFSDRVAVMLNGHIKQVGDTETVFSSPISEEVASFTGVENILTGLVTDMKKGLATIEIHGRELAVVGDYSIGDEVTLGIRPEDVVVETQGAHTSQTSARNHLYGTISRFTSLGSQFRIAIDCGFPLVALVTKISFSEMGFDVGMTVIASFKASAVHVLRHKAAEPSS